MRLGRRWQVVRFWPPYWGVRVVVESSERAAALNIPSFIRVTVEAQNTSRLVGAAKGSPGYLRAQWSSFWFDRGSDADYVRARTRATE